VREADLQHHLINTTGSAEKGAAEKTEKPAAETETHAPANVHRYEFGSAEDFQLQQGMNYLKGLPVETAKPHDKVAASEKPENSE